MRLIDLSVPLEHDAPSEPLPAKIHYVTHEAEGLAQMQQFFGVRVEDLVWSGGKGWAVEEIHAITHTGTHVDAPYHYGPLSEGKPARRIDEVPLEWCYAPGVILDVRSLPAGVEITVDFLRQALERIGYSLQPLDIVLLQTGCDQRIQIQGILRSTRPGPRWHALAGGAGSARHRDRRLHDRPPLCQH